MLRLTATKTKFMPWQAYSKLFHNDKGEGSLASRTDAAYYQYVQGITPEIKEKMQAKGERVKSRLHFLQEQCLADLASANEDTKKKVQQMIESGGQDVPDYLSELSEELTVEEQTRFTLNHKRHMWVDDFTLARMPR